MIADTDQKAAEMAIQTPKSRKITALDVRSMADLLSKRITETGACLILGIKYDTWLKWKQRAKNSSRFVHLLERTRETQIKAHIENIEAAAMGEGPHARADWRASDALLKLKAPDRFSDKHDAGQPTTHVTITVDKLQIINQMVQAELAKERAALPGAEAKQIECSQLGEVTTTQDVSPGNDAK